MLVILDLPALGQFTLQDPASLMAKEVNLFHDSIIFYLLFILGFVSYFIFFSFGLFSAKLFKLGVFSHGSLLEIIWTISPAILLLFIALPSFRVLYLLDEYLYPITCIKVLGHQWYWTYEFSNVSEDSYILQLEDIPFGGIRLLEVDLPLFIPSLVPIRFIITSSDVIHSWAIPSIGIKIDAIPGRLNCTDVIIDRVGTFYGQCSELCGSQHGFMPIKILSCNLKALKNTIS